ADERLRLRDRLEQLAERPRSFLRRARPGLRAEKPAQRLGRDRVWGELLEPTLGLRAEELDQHLDDGEVRDPFAVRDAAPAHDARAVETRKRLLDEPGLPHPRGAEEREQHTRALV